MKNINEILAMNLKRLREERKLSLDNLADITGVSKSMLGQIERGDSSPTITTILKITNGLKITFSSLLSYPQPDTLVITKDDIDPLIEDNGKYKLYPFFPYEEERNFEIYAVEIEEGGYLNAEPHIKGTKEFITVFAGELTVRVGDKEYKIKEGESIQFRADQSHSYHNSGDKYTKISMVIFYSQNDTSLTASF